MRYMFRAAVIPAAVLAAAGLSLATANASMSQHLRTNVSEHTATVSNTAAVTVFHNVPDNGWYGGDWGIDNFTQSTTVKLIGSVSTSTPGCGSTWTRCYEWTASVRDIGTTTTIPNGAGPLPPGLDPRTGIMPEQVTETLTFRGGSPDVVFFASTNKAYAYLVPTFENAMFSTAPTDENNPFPYVNRFFPSGTGITPISSMNAGHWSWTYTLPAGGDSQCPMYGPATFTDAWNEMGNPAAMDSGDVYAYDRSTCPKL